ncbi:unnamed protein product [Caenorhabditis sp. 36 PRJEB53466]|nr:unnamed protein product [Caenorhabditis sp. 36 PRJEB53466]
MTVEEDTQQALDAVKTAATVLKESVDAGMYIGKKCVPQLAVFVELGLVVRTVIGFTEAGQKDPVMEEIGSLERKLEKIEEKMKDNFQDLKAFVAEHSFYTDVPLASKLLFQSMQDAMKTPGEDSQKEFREQCEATQPLEYARRLKYQLMKPTTNPLKMTMAAHPLDGAVVFKKWNNIYDSILTQLCLIEAISSGLLYKKNKYRVDLIEKEYKEFEKRIQKWDHEYRTNDHYWPDAIRKIVEDVQDKRTDKNGGEKAEIIRTILERIFTDDIFYITVFKNTIEHVCYASEPSQAILSLNRGDHKVIVYRSRKARREPEKVADLKKHVEAMRTLNWPKDQYEWPKEESLKWFADMFLRESGFVLMAKARETDDIGVQSTSKSVFEHGPGHHLFGSFRPQDSKTLARKVFTPFFIVAGYK